MPKKTTTRAVDPQPIYPDGPGGIMPKEKKNNIAELLPLWGWVFVGALLGAVVVLVIQGLF